MRKAVFFGVLAIFSLFLPRLILAESGCGGIDFCQSTKIVNEYTCREIEGSCQKEGAGTQTIDCTVTEDECYGFQYTPRCAYNLLGACEEQGFTRKKVSCCSGAGGGGGQDCPSGEYELVKECKPTNQCPADRTGAKCGQGKKWCYSLVCVGCTATAPTNLTFTPFQSGSSAVVSWVDGAGGTSNRLYVDSRKEDVDADCPNGQGSGNGKCLYVNNNASSGVAVSGLSLGTVYYVKVVNYKDGTCSANSSILSDVSSCFISPSGPVNMKVGDKQTFTTSVNTSLEIQRVDFSAPPGNISITPGSDTNGADGYKTEVTALNSTSPTVTLTSDVYFTGNPTPVCSSEAQINITDTLEAWWQVKDADVTAMGNIASQVVSGDYFGLAGAGGYPGVPVYNGTADFGDGAVSEIGWLTGSSVSQAKVYDYNYFESKIPDSIIPTTILTGNLTGATPDSRGYEWYKYTGPVNLTIDSNIALGGRKVILLVENADLILNAKINLADGAGFFGAFVNGKIIVDPSVGGGGSTPHLEGIYLADSSFSTGAGDTQLRIRGSVAAYGGVSLQRNLADNEIPAEFFEFAPDQIVLFPSRLGTRKMDWKEVAP